MNISHYTNNTCTHVHVLQQCSVHDLYIILLLCACFITEARIVYRYVARACTYPECLNQIGYWYGLLMLKSHPLPICLSIPKCNTCNSVLGFYCCTHYIAQLCNLMRYSTAVSPFPYMARGDSYTP